MKKIFFYTCLFILFNFNKLNAQHYSQTQGIPFIKNIFTEQYSAHEQNFDVIQDKQGIYYFANFAGIMAFDGTNFNLIQTSSGMRVICFNESETGVIYAGGLYDFGYILKDEKGMQKFITLTNYLTIDKNEIGLIHSVVCLGKSVYFASDKYLFCYENNKISIIEQKNIIKSVFLYENNIYLYLDNKFPNLPHGLVLYSNKKYSNISENSEDIINDAVFITKIPNSKDVIIGTSNQGLFLLQNNNISETNYEVNNYFKRNILTSVAVLNNNMLAFGTLYGGVVLTDTSGKIIQIIDIKSGLSNENINNIYLDKYNSLWAATNMGVSKIETNINLNYTLFESIGIKGRTTGMLLLNKILYISTDKGLYFVHDSISGSVGNITGIITDIISYKESVLVATGDGVFVVSEKKVQSFFQEEVVYCLMKSNIEQNIIYAGQTGKISILKINDNKIQKTEEISNFKDEVRKISEEKNGDLLIELATGKVLFYNIKSKKLSPLKSDFDYLSLHVNNIRNENFFCSENGIYKYTNEILKPYNFLSNDTGLHNMWLYNIEEIKKNKFFIIDGSQKNSSFLVLKNDKIIKQVKDFLPISDFVVKKIVYNKDYLYIAGKEGFIIYNLNLKDIETTQINTILTKVYDLNNDSLISVTSGVKGVNLMFSQNSLAFEYTYPKYPAKGEVFYKYFLEGFDKDTSLWTKQTRKDYTNLPDGKYLFTVLSKDEYGNISNKTVYRFHILTPLYRQWWSFIIYLFLILAALKLFLNWRMQQSKKEKDALEKIVKERTEEIENQKEEILLQSEEMEIKNEELEKINSVVQSVNKEIEFSALLNSMLQKIQEITSADIASSLVLDEKQDVFIFKASYGFDIQTYNDIKLKMEEVEERYLKHSEEIYKGVFYTKDIQNINLYKPSENMIEPKSMLVISVEVNSKILGFLILFNLNNSTGFKSKHFRIAASLKEHINSAFLKASVMESLQDTLENLKETQNELIRQEKLASVGQLTKGIVDRIINPLNYINNYSEISGELLNELHEIVSNENIDNEANKEYNETEKILRNNLEKIHEHGKSTARIVKAMEKLLKEKSNIFTRTDINTLVRNVLNYSISEFKKTYSDYNPKIITDIKEQIFAEILPEEINDVIQNILHNAYFATLNITEPTINVKVKIENSLLEISIKDNGQGIAEKEILKIFDPFFTTKKTAQGSGLGLYMCKEIVEIHKGNLFVCSELNTFTEFTISIPTIKQLQ